MIDILLDALIDVLKLIPFLFISFLVMELIEHKLNNKKILNKVNKFGPLTGATLGIIPQCGFSALASNLYAAKVITLGTLFSIYLSTSDEMIPIMISHKVPVNEMVRLLSTKFILGLLFGIFIDIFFNKKIKNDIASICHDDDCHCEEGIVKSAFIHTIKISLFILIVNICLNIIIDKDIIISFINNNKVLAPIIMSLIGLIPNCAASVIITELYLEEIISFGSCIAGLLAGSGVGILVLFRQNKNIKENIMIVAGLIIFASISGIIINLL